MLDSPYVASFIQFHSTTTFAQSNPYKMIFAVSTNDQILSSNFHSILKTLLSSREISAQKSGLIIIGYLQLVGKKLKAKKPVIS
jgi:hypothetical protein